MGLIDLLFFNKVVILIMASSAFLMGMLVNAPVALLPKIVMEATLYGMVQIAYSMEIWRLEQKVTKP